MRRFSIFSFLLVLLLPLSCRKQTDGSYELIGKWFSCNPEYSVIRIDANGRGGYASGPDAATVPGEKKVKANENTFKIGNEMFKISVQPEAFDSAADWRGCVADLFTPGHMPLRKMQVIRGRTKIWFYLE